LHRDEEMKEKIEYFQKTGQEPRGSREWIQKALNTPSHQPQTRALTPAQQSRAHRFYRGLEELGRWWRNRAQKASTMISAQPAMETQTDECEVQLLSPPNPADAPIPMDKIEEPELVPVRPKSR